VKSSAARTNVKTKTDLENKHSQEIENFKQAAQIEFNEEIAKYESHINQLTIEIEQYKQQIAKLSKMSVTINQFDGERSKYDSLIKKLKTDIMELEQQVQNLLHENAELTDTSFARFKEIESLKAKVASSASLSVTTTTEERSATMKAEEFTK